MKKIIMALVLMFALTVAAPAKAQAHGDALFPGWMILIAAPVIIMVVVADTVHHTVSNGIDTVKKKFNPCHKCTDMKAEQCAKGRCPLPE